MPEKKRGRATHCAGETLCRPHGGQELFAQMDNLYLLSLHKGRKARKKAAEIRRLGCT
jgi:hypothetical protein